MLDPRLFRRRSVSAMALVTLLQSIAIYPVLLFLALELQGVFGFNALEAGLRVLPVTAALLVVAPLAGALTSRVPLRYLLATGLAITAVGLLVGRTSEVSSGWQSLLPSFFLIGVGIGVLSPAVAAAIMGALPDEQVGLSSGIGNTFRQVGIALGIAILGVVFDGAVGDTAELAPILAGLAAPTVEAKLSFHAGLEAVLLAAAVVAALGVVASFWVRERAARSEPGQLSQALNSSSASALT